MKLTIFAILLLAFMVSLTMVQVESNIETQFEALSAAEMRATQGFGACERVTAVKNKGACTSSKCSDILLLGVPVLSVKVDAKWHLECGPQDFTKDCIQLEGVGQICAEASMYSFGGCDPANLISVHGLVIPALRAVDGCQLVGTSS